MQIFGRAWRIAAVLAGGLTMGLPAFAATDQGLFVPRGGLDSIQMAPESPSNAGGPINITRRRVVSLDNAAVARSFGADAVYSDGKMAPLNLFPDVVLDVRPDRRTQTRRGGTITEGAVIDQPLGEAAFLEYEGTITAQISANGKFYHVYPGADGTTVIDETVLTSIGPKGRTDVVGPETQSLAKPGQAPANSGRGGLSTPQNAAVNANITVLMLYTANVAADNPNIVADIELVVARTNRAFIVSGINAQLHLVGTAQVTLDDTKCGGTPDNGGVVGDPCITAMQQGIQGTGSLSGLQALRRDLGADITHIMVRGDGGGVGGLAALGYQISDGSDDASQAYGWTRASTIGSIVFQHELGHNLGLRHDRFQIGKENGTAAQDQDNFGFVDKTAKAQDSLAYQADCTDANLTCDWVNSYSSSGRVWPGNTAPAGRAMGVALGQSNPADNARVVNLSKEKAKAWRTGAATLPAPSVNVLRFGRGTGTVTSSAGGINCGATCKASVPANTVVTLTATPAAGSGFGGWIGDCRGDAPAVQITVTADATCSAYFLTAAQVVPARGWWWNASQGGRGYSIEVNPATGNLFFAAYTYQPSGQSIWYVATMTPVAGQAGVYSGGLIEGRAGQTLTGGSSSPTFTQIGAVTARFAAADRGEITWPASTGAANTAIERYPFSGTTASAPASSITYEAGWWYDASAPGTGYFIETQGGTLFMAGYLYRTDASPIWFVANGTMQFTNQFSGSLIEVSNGPTFTNPTKGPVTVNTATTITVTFTNDTTGRVELGNGRTINITRYKNF